ncbi:unnamed protein product [Phytophthora fragariaefolia]|uniref:Unnamed protein product n=1 Tax=Phytophthora fragariaefolia TaxID=1490495 RepID=A0A9W6XUU4_9STRA|nr:unnamed protein product [Phytophthora fragariaefolia]
MPARSQSQDRDDGEFGGNLGNVVSGYGAAWGTVPTPPRYDTAGRLVGTGKKGSGEWWKAIPPGYQLVPVGGKPVGPKVQTTGENETRGKRAHGGQASGQQGEQGVRKQARTFKVEGAQGSDAAGRL